MFSTIKNLVYEADGSGGSGDSQNNEQQEATLESWLEKQPDEVKNTVTPLFEAHIQKLSNSVKETRKERDTLARQLRDASKKLETGSAQQIEFEKIASDLDEANRRADFYEEAPSQGCRNSKAAFALAKANDYFTKAGLPDWKSIKADAPELFGKPSNVPRVKSAGSGTENEPVTSQTMSDWIRKEAGHTP